MSRMQVLTGWVLPAVVAALVPSMGAALVLSPNSTASDLADTLFLNAPGLSVTDSTLNSGEFGQLGTYENTSGTLGLPLDGIVLSSGNINDILTGGSTNIGGAATGAQNALLSPITGQSSHNDVADLLISFDAAPDVSSITFFAAFASEEWPNFVNSSFTDGFGLFVNGTNVAGVQPTGGGDNLPVNIDHPDMVDSTNFVADSNVGILAPNGNPVLRFDVPVNAGEENTFQILLADASDSVLDTGVFLSSFLPTDLPDGGGDDTTVGDNEFNPILPSNPQDPETGAFVLELPADLQDNQVVWIDPPVSVGYTYEVTGGAAGFASIVAPSLATIADLDGYLVTVGGTTVSLAAGASLDFLSVFGVLPASFTLEDIDPALALDPNSPLAFPLGVSLTGVSGTVTITQTPITVNTSPVPLPAGLWLMMTAVGVLPVLRRRNKAKAS